VKNQARDLRSLTAIGSDIARRWTPSLVKDGFTPISNYFLANYYRLKPKLQPGQVVLICHLIQFKWGDAPPRPSFKTLAERMSVTATAVRNHARALENAGYLLRIQRVAQPNLFDLRPLFEKLEQLMVEDAVRISAGLSATQSSAEWRDDVGNGEGGEPKPTVNGMLPYQGSRHN
jgi:hypothetical protein